MSPETQAAILEAHRREGPPDVWDRSGSTNKVIISVVSEISGIPKEALLGQRRTRQVARARQIIYLLIHQMRPALNWEDIGRILKRDRTTVMYGVRIILEVVNPLSKKYEPEASLILIEAKRELGA